MAEETRELVGQEQPDPQERRRKYNRIVREARLITILLSSINLKVNREVPRPAEEEHAKFMYGGQLVDFSFDKEVGVCFAGVEWTVQLKTGKRIYAKCVARYDAIYDQISEVDEDIARIFADSVARPATYAYFRALFASLDWASELGLPPLPVIKVYPKI